MGKEHLIKIVTFYGESVQKSCSSLNNKHGTNSVPEKATFFGYTTQN